MRYMKPINSNNDLRNKNHLMVGVSGAGKTTALSKMGIIKPTDQVAIWDPTEEYQDGFLDRQVRRYDSFSKLFQALYAGRQTNQGFKIALSVDETRDNFLKYCEIIKSLGDGHHKKLLFNVCEEIPNVVVSTAKEDSVFGWLERTGRKFGIVNCCMAQASTEIPKTVYRNSAYKWFGKQEDANDFKRIEAVTGVPSHVVSQMKNCDYIYKTPEGNKFGNLYAANASFEHLLKTG